MRIKRFNENIESSFVRCALFELKGTTRFGLNPSEIIFSAVSDDGDNLRNHVINICNECNETEFVTFPEALNYWNETMDTFFKLVNATSDEQIEDECWLAAKLNSNKLTEAKGFKNQEGAESWLNETMDQLAGWEIKERSMTTEEYKNLPFEEKIVTYNFNNRLSYFLYCKEAQFLRNVKINPEIIKKGNIKKFDL